ncbi:uncharacterized protein LOC116345948 isoform X2 [Contarinia nasturtii]|uniref:uncharacterized protein LOC116345948 isoform X2 n=1 Tax=Contarinia nasturtii TaxID=265458 RepID=UPI0012D3A645|nr:uncharacterized protein LOC116345948 isoform X2 [Contarinia nasturtii]
MPFQSNQLYRLDHASNFKPPQLLPHVKQAFERSAEASVERTDKNESHSHHQHYYIEQPLQSTQTIASTGTNGIVQKHRKIAYKPRIGEILVKDSVLYNRETPISSQQAHKIAATRRNYWPLVDNTVTSIASNAAAGANAVKNLLKVGFFQTFDNVNAAVEHKKHKIASYIIQAAQEHKIAMQQAKEDEKYKQQFKLADVTQSIPLSNQVPHPLLPLAKPLQQLLPLKQKLAQNVVQHLSKHLKKPIKKPFISPPWIVYSKTKTLPTTTVSDGYIHTFDNKYMPPNFDGPRERNPYADMGVTSYKHFEDTILKELEEKEERKVEATMHTLLDDQYVIHDSLEGTKPGSSQEWQPFNAHDNGLFTTSTKPVTINSFTQSTFDRPFNDVRPVCEHQDDVSVQPTLFVFPANAETHLNELQEASNDNTVKVKLTESDAIQTNSTRSNNSTTTEKPNYPAYFIKQQQELRKLQQKLVGAYRTKSQYGSKTTSVPTRGRQTSYGRRTTTTTTTTMATNSMTPTTTEAPVYFFSINGTDDGFRPMLPDQINAMKIKKPIRIKLNNTSTSSSSSNRPKSWIQAQASHVQLSVVAAPNATTKRAKATTTIGSRNDIKSSYTRKAPKKPTVTTGNKNNSTTIAKSNKNTYRGSIKFGDSLNQSQNS